MNPILYAFLGFVLLAVVLSFLFKKAVLSKMDWLPGEETLWEQEKCPFRVEYSNSTSYNPGGRAILTNQRLILSQKILLQKDWALRYILYFQGRAPQGVDFSLKGTMKRGFVNLEVPVEKLQIVRNEKGKEQLVIDLDIRESGLMLPGDLRMDIKDVPALQEALERVVRG